MKQTELDRKERDLRKERKRLNKESQRKLSGAAIAETLTLKSAYERLSDVFDYDENEIYNIHKNNEHLVEVLLEMQESFGETEVASTIRKAIKRTRIKEKEAAFKAVYAILE